LNLFSALLFSGSISNWFGYEANLIKMSSNNLTNENVYLFSSAVTFLKIFLRISTGIEEISDTILSEVSFNFPFFCNCIQHNLSISSHIFSLLKFLIMNSTNCIDSLIENSFFDSIYQSFPLLSINQKIAFGDFFCYCFNSATDEQMNHFIQIPIFRFLIDILFLDHFPLVENCCLTIIQACDISLKYGFVEMLRTQLIEGEIHDSINL
jgi:hypothetical protein